MTGVLLLNLGGPDSQEAVKPFLYNLFSDREIIKLGPWPALQKPFAWLISSLRADTTRRAYALIGGSSPILRITQAQARALEKELAPHGSFRVYVGMKYWHPFIEDAVAQAQADGVRELVALSLYPQYSAATTGASENTLKEIMRRYPIRYGCVLPWYDHPLYIEALADTISEALKEAPGAEVLFSAHSLPAKLIAGGDPYADQIIETIKAVGAKLDIRWHLGYQSRSGPVRWLEPSTDDVIRRLAAEGVKDVVVVPISFVSDHIETLYEIDILYKEEAARLGLRLHRASSLNEHPLFIGALKDLVLKGAEKLRW
jgi:ferrochelatase